MDEPKNLAKRIGLGKGKNRSAETALGNSESIPTSRSATVAECRLLLMAIQWQILAEQTLGNVLAVESLSGSTAR